MATFKERIGIDKDSVEPRGELYMHLPKLRIFADKKIKLAEQKN